MKFGIEAPISAPAGLEWKRGSARSWQGKGWIPVYAKEFDGMFMRRGHKGFVRRKGLTLMRPATCRVGKTYYGTHEEILAQDKTN